MQSRTTWIVIAACLVAGHLLTRGMDLRVDEIDYYDQILRYVDGDFTTTTSTLGGFSASAALLVRLTGLSGPEHVRGFALLASAATLLAFASLLRAQDPRAAPRRTLQLFFFPQLFPFWFLIYSDVYALMFLLLALLALERERFDAAGLLVTLGVGVRQTYAVWLAMLGSWTAIASADQTLGRLARRCASFAVGGALFVAFVIVNGGVAVGDAQAHPDLTIRSENLLFLLFNFCLLFLPIVIARLPRIARLHPALLAGATLASLALFFGTFRVDHPYNALGNGYYLRNVALDAITRTTAAGVVASLAIALAFLTLCVVRLRQPVHYLLYPFAVLSVVPSTLIEQRYYLPAFALFVLFREAESPRVERVLLGFHALLALYLFGGVAGGLFFL